MATAIAERLRVPASLRSCGVTDRDQEDRWGVFNEAIPQSIAPGELEKIGIEGARITREVLECASWADTIGLDSFLREVGGKWGMGKLQRAEIKPDVSVVIANPQNPMIRIKFLLPQACLLTGGISVTIGKAQESDPRYLRVEIRKTPVLLAGQRETFNVGVGGVPQRTSVDYKAVFSEEEVEGVKEWLNDVLTRAYSKL